MNVIQGFAHEFVYSTAESFTYKGYPVLVEFCIAPPLEPGDPWTCSPVIMVDGYEVDYRLMGTEIFQPIEEAGSVCRFDEGPHTAALEAALDRFIEGHK